MIKSPSALILPTKVDTPATLRSSKSVSPSTNKSPSTLILLSASILPLKVDNPIILRSPPTISLFPSKVKLASPSNSPPVPAMTT